MIFWEIRVFVSEIFVLLFIGLNKREMTSIIEKNTSSIISINFNFSLDNETLCITTSPRGLLKFNLQRYTKAMEELHRWIEYFAGIICHRGNFTRRSLTRYVLIFLL
jgi:hypothetical protein